MRELLKQTALGAGLAICLVAAAPSAASAANTGSYTLAPIGVPLSTGKMVFDMTITVNGKAVTKTVTIPSGDIVALVPAVCPAGTAEAKCLQMKADAISAASQAKAKVIADAINEAFKKEFKQLGMKATVGVTPKNIKVSYMGLRLPVDDVPFGTVTIPAVTEKQGDPFKWTSNGVLGEGGDGGKFNPPANGKSPGSKTSLNQANPNKITVAQGENPDGRPSTVEFGLQGGYIARVHPTDGETDIQVLEQLQTLLDNNGEAATFDPTTDSLSLNQVIPDGQTVIFGNTDVGLNFTFEEYDLSIPEPGVWAMMLLGFGGVGAMLRIARRRADLTAG
jgi:hypothetical protein